MVQHHPITFAIVNNSWSKSDVSPTADRFNTTILKLSIMKLYGIGGVGTGKLGNQVFAVKAGEQIVRQYQPVVANPNTPAQVATRSKMKLISQVAAVVAPEIAIPADGLRTKRNMFIKENYDLMTFSDNTASINLESMQLTKGSLAMPALAVTAANNQVHCEFAGNIQDGIDKVCFVVLNQDLNGKLRFETSRVVDVASASAEADFLVLGDNGENYAVLAYGIRPNSEKARLKLGEMSAPSSAAIASLIATRTLSETDVTLTETVGDSARLAAGN